VRAFLRAHVNSRRVDRLEGDGLAVLYAHQNGGIAPARIHAAINGVYRVFVMIGHVWQELLMIVWLKAECERKFQ
jgi:hypothetical protein